MKTLTLSAYTTVELPTKRSEWELYKEAGAYKSATKLTAALAKACRKAYKEIDNGKLAARGQDKWEIAESLYDQYVWPVACKCSAGGATDTEPRSIAQAKLAKLVVALINV